MSLPSRPRALFDVDLYGLGALSVLLALGWFGVGAPWQEIWSVHRALATGHEQVENQLQDDIRELERYEQGLEELRGVVAVQAADVPAEADLPQVLREMTGVAQAANVEIRSVAPQPGRHEGLYRVSDIEVTGRGTSRDFIRFLDEFARRNPYHGLRACALAHTPENPDARCDVSWTLRLYLLPRVAAGPGG